MPNTAHEMSLQDLSEFVHHSLCELDSLIAEQTPLHRSPLKKNGSLCGYIFHIEGPRLLRTSAVWSADENRVIIYNSHGQRVKELILSDPVAITS